MRLLTILLLFTTTLLPRMVQALSLALFQPIVSFPSACTSAYDTPISGCTAQDFAGGNPCSENCIASLQSISDKINAACVGTRADPSTLIGLFFQGEGVKALCPNAGAGSASNTGSSDGNAGIGSGTMIASINSFESSIAAATTSGSTSTSITSTATKQSSKSSTLEHTLPSTTSTSTSPTAAITFATSSPPSISTTVSPTLRGGFTSTAVNNGVASVVTSKAQQTGNPDGFGGGGSPFEVGVNGGIAVGASGVRTGLLVALVVALGMLMR